MDAGERDDYQRQLRELRAELEAERSGHRLQAVPDTPPLRQRDIIRALLEERGRRAATGERSTVRLTRNSKGDTQLEVYVGTGDAEGIDTPEDAAARARQLYDALRLVYPLTEVEKAESAKRGGDGA